MKDLIDSKTDSELYKALIAEVAKANNELKCARADIEKAQNRLGFVLVVLNRLTDRNNHES